MKYNIELANLLDEITSKLHINVEVKDNGKDMWVYDYDNNQKFSIKALINSLLKDNYLLEIGYNKNTINKLKNAILRVNKIHTIYGDFYYTKQFELYTLYDTDKEFITYFEKNNTIEQIKNIKCISELVEILELENVIWGETKQDIIDEINETLQLEDDEKIKQENIYFYRVGKTYFVVNYD